MSDKAIKRPVTVYHVHLLDDYNKEMDVRDYYFGSISAIYDVFEKWQVGIKASSLYNLNLDEATNPTYENKRCRIRKATLITKSKSK